VKVVTLTQDHSHHTGEAGPRGLLVHTPHRTYCRVPARRRHAVHDGQPGYVCTRRPRSHRAPGSDETPDDRPDTCSRSAAFTHNKLSTAPSSTPRKWQTTLQA